LLAACVAGSANAAFVGFAANVTQDGTWGVARVYAMFSQSGEVALNVFNSNISLIGAGAFNHNDLNTQLLGQPGAWSQSATLASPIANPGIDSYVTIGNKTPSVDNGTLLDPSFNPSTGGSVPANAGWYNGSPGNQVLSAAVEVNQNDTGSNFGVLVGQFVVNNPNGQITSPRLLIAGEVGYGSGQTGFSSKGFDYIKIPTPGALALVGLAGLAARRRRA